MRAHGDALNFLTMTEYTACPGMGRIAYHFEAWALDATLSCAPCEGMAKQKRRMCHLRRRGGSAS